MNAFELEVKNNLLKAGISFDKEIKIGVAVSGGADSVSLLISLCNILPVNFSLYVITVNHFIRPDEETCKDVEYVESLCDVLRIQRKIVLKVAELKKGSVASLVSEKKCGVEDAARILRYECFESFIKQNKLDYLCLAHNKNDQIETLLMRFFQGSQIDACGGIPFIRGKYIRPLLSISRKRIEKYLKGKNIYYRTDSTNLDTTYLRNRLRLEVIPYLDSKVQGWQESVLNGGEKALEDALIIDSIVQKIPLKIENGIVQIERNVFCEQMDGIKRRLLLKAFDLISNDLRVPYVFIKEVIEVEKKSSFNDKNEIKKEFSDICVLIRKNELIIKNSENSQTNLFFSAIMEEDGEYNFPIGIIEVKTVKKSENQQIKQIICNGIESECFIEYPFIIRNFDSDDFVKTSDNKYRKVLKIYSDWHVPNQLRCKIPVIQNLKKNNQDIKGILGKSFGFKDWIVK